MALVAAGLGGALILAIGVWHVVSRHRVHEPPVIEADSRPLRVRPDNPGGMQVPGGDETIMGDNGSHEADALAPPPETPAPQALRDQQQPHPAAATPTAPPAADTAAPPAATAAKSAAAPPATAKAAEKPPASGAVQVQLAALDSETVARAEWQRMVKRAPDLFAKAVSSVESRSSQRTARASTRVRTGGFADSKPGRRVLAPQGQGEQAVIVASVRHLLSDECGPRPSVVRRRRSSGSPARS